MIENQKSYGNGISMKI